MRSTFRSGGILGNPAVALALLILALPAMADTAGPPLNDEQRARLDARIQEVRTRLDLSDEQRARLEPVLQRDFERRLELLRKNGLSREGGERPSRRDFQALRRDLQKVREQTEAEVDRILDDRQMAEYRKIQEEARGEMREKMRSRRSDNDA